MGLRILWVSSVSPVPATDGNRLRCHHLLKAAAESHAVMVVCPEGDDPKATRSWIRDIGADPRTAPGPDPGDGGLAGRLGRRLASAVSLRPHCILPANLAQLCSIVERLNESRQFDLAFGWFYAAEAVLTSSSPVRILDCQNVDSELYERLLSLEPPGPRRVSRFLDWRAVRAYERKVLPQADLVTVCSRRDARIHQERVPGISRVAVVPNGADVARMEGVTPDYSGRRIVFVGNLAYEPNMDACRTLARRVMPGIWRRHPEASLCVVGNAPERAARELAMPGVELTGAVSDVRDALASAAVAVAPLRAGGGTRLKVLEGMAAGLPVVASTLAVEGLDVADQDGVLVEDDWERMSALLADLLDEPERLRRLGQLARGRVRTEFDWKTIGSTFRSVLESAAA